VIGWIDAASGASGDMLLAALLDAGVDDATVRGAVTAVAPEGIRLLSEPVRRGGLRGLRVHVDVADSSTHRGLRHVLHLISTAGLDDRVASHATDVFIRLAEAEAAVHGISTD
jgi:pyridinium-3,5-bisthiocarboxylic acid mononucleotide nickel chelatase